tara:strand:- start:6199 stop:6414 length:216 start_codon:yes stop_codon:yes gene_type:complete
MESTLLIILFYLGFCSMVYRYATSLGRNSWYWAIVAVLFSPLIAGIFLLIVGKTIEKKAEELMEMKRLMDR